MTAGRQHPDNDPQFAGDGRVCGTPHPLEPARHCLLPNRHVDEWHTDNEREWNLTERRSRSRGGQRSDPHSDGGSPERCTHGPFCQWCNPTGPSPSEDLRRAAENCVTHHDSCPCGQLEYSTLRGQRDRLTTALRDVLFCEDGDDCRRCTRCTFPEAEALLREVEHG